MEVQEEKEKNKWNNIEPQEEGIRKNEMKLDETRESEIRMRNKMHNTQFNIQVI